MTTKFHAEKSLLDIERDINHLLRTVERVEKPAKRVGWLQTLHKTINRLEHLYSYVQQEDQKEDERVHRGVAGRRDV